MAQPQLLAFIQRTILSLLSHQSASQNIFDLFIQKCRDYYDRPINSIAEIKASKNTKLRGDIFEHFCLLYLQYCYRGLNRSPLINVWLLADLPTNLRQTLGLTGQDLGIDLIGQDEIGRHYAIQAKFRTPNRYKQKTGVSWKELSTFYSWVQRTGPYVKHIVITNIDYVRHVGKKSVQDQSICLGTLRKITPQQWFTMSASQGQKLNSVTITECLTEEEIRQKRLAYFKALP